MKIKMLTTSAGPDPKANWCEGDTRDVCVEEARYWYTRGVCKIVEPFPEDIEKAIGITPEKAVVKPPETAVTVPSMIAKVAVTDPVVKPPVKAPDVPAVPAGKSNSVVSAKAATWGTPEVK